MGNGQSELRRWTTTQPSKVMKCIHCKGEMEQKTAPFQITRKGYHLVLSSIPVWVCTQCGEVYFEEAEVHSIQEVLQTLDEQTKKLAIAA